MPKLGAEHLDFSEFTIHGFNMIYVYELICALYTYIEFDKNYQKQCKGVLFSVNGWRSEVKFGTTVKPFYSETCVMHFSCVIRQ